MFKWLVILVSLLMVVASPTIQAREQYPGQFAQISPEIREWFKNYTIDRPPGGSFGCCDVSDCHILTSDFWDTVGRSEYWIYIEEDINDWVKVPDDNLVLDKGNPTDGAVACYRSFHNGKDVTIYCFTPGYLI